MQYEELLHSLEPVDHAIAVITAAGQLFREAVEPAEVTVLGTQLVSASVTPMPCHGMAVTVMPQAGPVQLVGGVSVVLRPPKGTAHPVRFGALDDLGQLKVSALAEVPHTLELRPPWWLDDEMCGRVLRGQLGPAQIEAPVGISALRDQGDVQAAPSTLAALGSHGVQPPPRADGWVYLSADGTLEYTIMKTGNGDLTIDAGLHDGDPGGLAAVCLGEVAPPNTLWTPLALCSSVFDQRDAAGWWRAHSMQCKRVVMLGARAQRRPLRAIAAVPARTDEWLADALSSRTARRRRGAAMALMDDLLAPLPP